MTSSDQSQEWKDKYLSALDKCDATEARLKQAENLLSLSIARLSVAASGSDKILDEQLDKLKRISKKRPEPASLKPMLEEISLSIKRLELELQAGHAHRLPANTLFAKALARIEFPGTLRKQAKTLGKSLQRKNALSQMDAHLSTFCELLDSAIDFGENSSKSSPRKHQHNDVAKESSAQSIDILEHQQTILTQIMERLDTVRLRDAKGYFDEAASATFCQEVRRAKNERELIATAESLFDVFSDNQQLPTIDKIGAEADTSSQSNSTLEASYRPRPASGTSAETHFLTLLEMLPLPNELRADAQKVAELLQNSNDNKDWKEILDGVSDLIIKMQSNLEQERSELQAFLEHLTDQLNEIDSSLVGTERHQTASFEDGKKLDDNLRTNLASLKTSLDSENSLSSLRQVIDSKMGSISSYLEEFRSAEDERRDAITQEMNRLRNRLSQMESQTTDLKENLIEERRQARTDSLTGLNNRMAYEQALAAMHTEWQQGNSTLNIIICDIDHFKKINDNFGHQAGDRALQSIASILQLNVAESEMLARFGGEEFVLLIANADIIETKAIAEKLRAEVEKASFKFRGEQIPITISCGYSAFRPGDEPSAAFRRADEYLYEAKKRGRNRCVGDE